MSNFDKEREELDIIANKLCMEPSTMFYGLFLAEIPRRVGEIPGIETACLHAHSVSTMPEMFFSAKFWNSLEGGVDYRGYKGMGKKMFLVRHELDHYVKTHINMSHDFGWTNPLANIAMDLSINTLLLKEADNAKQAGDNRVIHMEMVEGGMLPSLYPELNMESCKDSRYYYDILIQAKQNKQQSAGKGEDSKYGEPGNKKGTSGSKLLDAQIEQDEDWHKGWKEVYDGLSDVEKEVRKRELLKKIEQVAEATERSKGTVPEDIKSTLANLAAKSAPTVPWQTLFRRFIGSTISSEIITNKKRPSRRFEDAFANKYKQKISVGFFSDSRNRHKVCSIGTAPRLLYYKLINVNLTGRLLS